MPEQMNESPTVESSVGSQSTVDATVQDPLWGVQMMAEGWSDAITEARKRIEQLEGKLARLLQLWTAQTSTVRVEPGEALLIGGLRSWHDDLDAVLQAVADLRQATGISQVWLFAEDIDVKASELIEQKHARQLEERIRKAQDWIDDAKEGCACHGSMCWPGSTCCGRRKLVEAQAILDILSGSDTATNTKEQADADHA
jgi:hypothetical protein